MTWRVWCTIALLNEAQKALFGLWEGCCRGPLVELFHAVGALRSARTCLFVSVDSDTFSVELDASNGCDYCQLPRDFCPRWTKREGGGWRRISGGRCKYSQHLLCDGIIGFYTCGTSRYHSDIYDEVEEYLYCMSDEERMSYSDEEAAASWLSQPLVVAGVEASQMVRQLSIWIHGLDAFSAWKTEKGKDGGTKG